MTSDSALEMTSDSPTNAGKHVTSNVLRVCIAIHTLKIQSFGIAQMTVVCYDVR